SQTPSNNLELIAKQYVDSTELDHLNNVSFNNIISAEEEFAWDGSDWTDLPPIDPIEYHYKQITVTPSEISNGISMDVIQYEVLKLDISDTVALQGIADIKNCIGYITITFDNLYGDISRN